MSEPPDVFNRFVVCSRADTVIVGIPPRAPMTPVDALILAAWLVALAEPMSAINFKTILHEVLAT